MRKPIMSKTLGGENRIPSRIDLRKLSFMGCMPHQTFEVRHMTIFTGRLSQKIIASGALMLSMQSFSMNVETPSSDSDEEIIYVVPDENTLAQEWGKKRPIELEQIFDFCLFSELATFQQATMKSHVDGPEIFLEEPCKFYLPPELMRKWRINAEAMMNYELK